jgi:transposase
MDIDHLLKERVSSLFPQLTERQQRIAAAVDARALGYGGVSRVAKATGLSRTTIHRGLQELDSGDMPPERSRRTGGGRKKIAEQQPEIMKTLENMVDPSSRGDPMSPLRWTHKSTRQLAEALAKEGYQVSHPVVAEMLKEMDYSLQANLKAIEEGTKHPDRDAQFRYINARVLNYLAKKRPVISVDTKKKELVGRYKNHGRTYRKKGHPERVQVHDFIDKKVGKAIPYGVYDVGRNTGWVNVGCDHDTSTFAVESIWQWWNRMGQAAYPAAKKILICADAGGSNGYRLKLWKAELQAFATKTGLEVTVCHLPPGTSKWNKIEHRLFSYISMNWRGQPLVSHEVVVKLIGATTTKTGLKVEAQLDQKQYPTKVKVPKETMAQINLRPHEFHGEWNYTVKPAKQQK